MQEVPFIHWQLIPFGDGDPAGLVYTPRFVEHCMLAAESWLSDYVGADWYRMARQLDQGSPVVHLELDFKRAVRPGDRLGIELAVAGIGRSSLTVEMRGFTDVSGTQTSCFNAQFIFCFVNNSERAPIPIPDNYRERILAYQTAMESGHGTR